MAKKKTAEAKVAPVVEEPKVETPKVEEPKECPAEACQDLQNLWPLGVFGCFNEDSNYCKLCLQDFPKCAEVCKAGTVSKAAKVAATKMKGARTRVGGKTQVTYLDNALLNGATLEEMTQGLIDAGLSQRENDVVKRRVLKHIHHLRTADHHKYIVNKDDKGVYKIQATV